MTSAERLAEEVRIALNVEAGSQTYRTGTRNGDPIACRGEGERSIFIVPRGEALLVHAAWRDGTRAFQPRKNASALERFNWKSIHEHCEELAAEPGPPHLARQEGGK